MTTLGLNQLRVFEAVTRCGSFIRAAERLHVTPPAVSLQIHQLEEACGVPLFERLGRRVRLTPTGELLQGYAALIFTLVSDAEGAVQQGRGFENACLRIVTAATAATYYLPPLWRAITRRYPGLRVQLSVENSQRVRDRLVALEDDVGVIGGTSTHPDLVLVPLVNDPLVVVVGRGPSLVEAQDHLDQVTPRAEAHLPRTRLSEPRIDRGATGGARHPVRASPGDRLERSDQAGGRDRTRHRRALAGRRRPGSSSRVPACASRPRARLLAYPLPCVPPHARALSPDPSGSRDRCWRSLRRTAHMSGLEAVPDQLTLARALRFARSTSSQPVR